MQTKKCSKCAEEKTIDNFRKAKGYQFGVSGICEPCRRAWLRDYKSKNKELFSKYSKEWKLANPEKWEQIQIRSHIKFLEKRGYVVTKPL